MTTQNAEIQNQPADISVNAQAPFPSLATVPPGEQKLSNKSMGKQQPSKTTTVITKVTKTPTLPGESAINLALIAKAVHKINNIHQNGALKTATAIGEYLLKTFFGGDLDAFKAKEKKHASFRALSERDDLSVGHSSLWYSIAVLDQLRQLPSDLGQALPMSHHRLLIPVKDAETKLST